MGTINKYSKSDYMELPSTKTQLDFIERGKQVVKSYTKDGFKLLSISEGRLYRILQMMNKARLVQECDTPEHLEKLSLIYSSRQDVWPLSQLYIAENDYFYKVLKHLTSFAEDWIERPLKPEIVFGPRRYNRSSRLLNHVDRARTHIISITMTLDYEVEEEWPLVLEIENEIVEVILKPGEYLFYEGARIPHSRPHPLNGKFYTNMYFHWSVLEG